VKKPLVSVVTPCYNGEAYIEVYLQSILKQTYENIELILVDDGSNDRTKEIIDSYRPKFKERNIEVTYLYQENKGQAAALRNGLKKAQGCYLVWPDSDDWLDKSSIEKRVDFLEENPMYGMVRSNGTFFSYDSGEIISRISEKENRYKEDIFLDLIEEKTYCCCGCYMMRLGILKEFYPEFDIYISGAGQNWQLLIPVAANYKCGFIDEDLYHVAVREGSHSREKRNYAEQIALCDEYIKVLQEVIKVSGRKDTNLEKIIEIKYLRKKFRISFQENYLEEGKAYFKSLKKTGTEMEIEDWLLYYRKTNLFLYVPVRTYYCLFRK